MEKISIIIPMYNLENFIVECLKSIERQSYKNFEVIIVDDGSTDLSNERASEFLSTSNLDSFIVKQSNKGVSSARNTGIKHSTGIYLCFIDGDDMVESHYLERLYNGVVLNNVELSICSLKVVNEAQIIENYQSDSAKEVKIVKYTSQEILEAFLFSKLEVTICSLLIKKAVIQKNNFQFSNGAKYSEDLEFVWKLMAIVEAISLDSSELYLYRTRNGSAMSQMDSSRKDGLILYENLEQFFKNVNLNFYELFKKYGAAKWVWSTIWQVAVSSDTYTKFKNEIKLYQPRTYLKKLIFFKNKKISLSSILFLLFPSLYYRIVKVYGLKRLNYREFSD